MAYRRNRYNPFRRQRVPRAAVTVLTVTVKRPTKCKGCGGAIAAGETIIKLKLKKALRFHPTNPTYKLTGSKRFHQQCAPADPNAAMGYDPSLYVNYTPPPPASRGGAVPPPPKPQSADDAALAALAALEHAIITRAARHPQSVTAEVEAQFKTYQGIKARALRPGTDAEGNTAMKMALTRALKLVFDN